MSDSLINLSYIIYLVAFLVTDMLWLRLLVIASSLAMVAYGAITGTTPILAWNLVFLSINGFQVVRILLNRRPVILEPALDEIYQASFRIMPRRVFLRFWNLGVDKTVVNQRILEQGQVPDHLNYLLEGRVHVRKDGRVVATLSPQSFFGEMSVLNQAPASGHVQAEGEARLRQWSRTLLTRLEKKETPLYHSIIVILGQDLSRKVIRSEEKTQEPVQGSECLD